MEVEILVQQLIVKCDSLGVKRFKKKEEEEKAPSATLILTEFI